MKIYSISILRNNNNKKTLELCSAKELSQFGFFERKGVSQFMTFFGETVAGRTQPGQRQTIEEGDYVGHVYSRSEGICGVLITDKEYPVRPAYTFLNKVLDEYLVAHPVCDWRDVDQTNESLHMDELDVYLQRYQDPSQADVITRVQHELDETKIVLHKTIESVLQRGERLDNLVDKSESLSASSRLFYKQAKKTNSCCILM